MPMLIPIKPTNYLLPRLIDDSSTNHLLPSFDMKASVPWFCVISYSLPALNGLNQCSFKCNIAESTDPSLTVRRSGNYKPSHWSFDYIQSLNSKYTEDRYKKRASELMVQVSKMLLVKEMKPVERLELIDDLQRLGISFHFEEEIKKILNCLYKQKYCKNNIEAEQKELYSTALEFRLLRQHGFTVSQEVFDCFKNEKGDFKSSLGEDTKGLLQLYEASFMLTESEDTLERAREFSTMLLERKLDDEGRPMDDHLSLMVQQALELPLHWRIRRPNARWFVDAYERKKNPVVLEFAKLDFNIVQAAHQEELKEVSRWWKTTSLATVLPFARDRLVECYFWTSVGLLEPKYRYSRIVNAKLNALITVIDDIFDVYGNLEELQLFNDAIQRWDFKEVDRLPFCMQMCLLELNNFVDDVVYEVLKQQGIFFAPHLRKSWADLCRAYIKEAEWYSRGYTPKLEEYIDNAWISISGPVILTHLFFLVTDSIEEEAVKCLYKYHDIVRWSSMILRLANDLGTSPDEMKRGDVPKSVQCYMDETGASCEEAQEHIRFLMHETWKKINQELVADSPFSRAFITRAVDVGRMAQYMYHKGDGHGIQNCDIKNRISSVLFHPVA